MTKCIKCGKPARPYSDHCTPCLRAIEALDRAMAIPYRDATETCQRCGRKGTPPCACATPDRPVEHPDTGWKIL